MKSIYEAKLQTVVMHITKKCANRCPFCYAYSEEQKSPHADIKTLIAIVDELRDAEISMISLLGGDPALHPHIIELARYIQDQNLRSSLMSNTMFIPNSSISEMIALFSCFEATILGTTAKEHDASCRNHGAYDMLIGNLQKLTECGSKIGIAINIIPKTTAIVYDMIRELIVTHGVKIDYVIVQRIIPFGGASTSKEYSLTKALANQALDGVDRVHNELGVNIMIEDPFPLCVIDEKYKKYMHPCEWGFTKAALNANGDLSRCGADPRYLLGNIFEKKINEIWKTSEILHSFRSRDYLPRSCQICPDRELCGGGCPLSCEVSGDHGLDYLYLVYKGGGEA